jgi:CheY-like chemotaxis protein
LALTAFALNEERRKTAAAGFDAHITKPVDVQGLSRTGAEWTGRLN